MIEGDYSAIILYLSQEGFVERNPETDSNIRIHGFEQIIGKQIFEWTPDNYKNSLQKFLSSPKIESQSEFFSVPLTLSNIARTLRILKCPSPDNQSFQNIGIICGYSSKIENISKYDISTNLLKDLVWFIPENALVIAQDGIILFANKEAADLFRTFPESLNGTNIVSRIAHHDRKKILEISRKSEYTNIEDASELDFLTIDNQLISSWTGVKYLKTEDGNRILLLITNITRFKEMEDKIHRLASIPRLNPSPVIEFSLEQKILYSNKATTDLLIKTGISKEPGELLPDDIETIISEVSENLSTPAIYHREIIRNNRVFSLTLHYTPDFVSFRLYADDITEQVHARQAMKDAIRKLNLLSSITRHDIKNNLQVLRGYLGLVIGKTDNETLEEYLSQVDRAAKSINHQIEFSRDYQMIGIHKPVWQNLSQIILEICGGFNLRNVTVKTDIEGISIYADPMVRKLFHNLMDNSLRHGGEVSLISITWKQIDQDLLIVYEDNGRGIPKEKKIKLFSPETSGGGHGLFLVHEILEITKISIIENGIQGQGAHFEIRVPQAAYQIEK